MTEGIGRVKGSEEQRARSLSIRRFLSPSLTLHSSLWSFTRVAGREPTKEVTGHTRSEGMRVGSRRVSSLPHGRYSSLGSLCSRLCRSAFGPRSRSRSLHSLYRLPRSVGAAGGTTVRRTEPKAVRNGWRRAAVRSDPQTAAHSVSSCATLSNHSLRSCLRSRSARSARSCLRRV